jgi:hypothetical protein
MRRILALVSIVTMLCLTGCGKFKEIKVNSVNVEKVTPHGLKGLDVKLGVNIENPAPQIKLSDMEATVKYSGKVLGKVTVDPFTMKGRTTETYHLKAKMSVDKGVSLYDVLMFLDKNYMDKLLVDITVKGQLKVGISKTITKKDVPLKKLLENAK